MRLFDVDWDPEWPATREEVDEWAIEVASEEFDEFREFADVQVLSELLEAGFSSALVAEMMVADARFAFEEIGKSGFELEAWTQAIRRCLEAQAARVEIDGLPEADGQ